MMHDCNAYSLFIHSINDESITKQKVCGISLPTSRSCGGIGWQFRISFVTLTVDYRYLILVGYAHKFLRNAAKKRYNIYVMDLKSSKWQFRRCDMDILIRGSCHFAVSCTWNHAEVALTVDGYFRELHLSQNEITCVLPGEVHNVIANYISTQELLHYIGKGVHFALSIEDILLERLDYGVRHMLGPMDKIRSGVVRC